MDKHLKPLALALALSLSAGTSALAADGSELISLRQQVTNGNTQAAWQQAQKMQVQWETDAEFDYLYGVLALENGKYNEAQFALERVTVAEPGNARARLALAKAYYKLGDKHSATRQFEAVKATNPPDYIMRDVNHYLAEMGEGRGGNLNGFVEGGFGHDNNINAATSGSSIANPVFDPLDVTSDPYILLNGRNGQQSDMFDYLRAGLGYYQPLTADTGIEAGGQLAARNNFSSDRYDNNIYRGNVGIVHVIGKNQLRATLTAQDYRRDDSDYQEYYSLSGDWTRYNFGGWTFSAAVFINELRYDDDPLLDVNQYLGNVAVQRQFGRVSHSIGLVVGDEDAEHDNADYNARKFSAFYYDLGYQVTGAHKLFGRLYYQNAHNEGEDPFFLQTKDDNYNQVTFGWDWHLSVPLRLRTELIYSGNDSDIDYYSYDRTRLQTGLRYSF
jgi:tetratricopeptide (TPR) repeat protein